MAISFGVLAAIGPEADEEEQVRQALAASMETARNEELAREDGALARAMQESLWMAEPQAEARRTPSPKLRETEHDAFLVIGVSENERERTRPHFPDKPYHPLIQALRDHLLPPNTYFLDKQTLPESKSSHFIHGDFSEHSFAGLAKRFPDRFTNIYFDYSTTKFIPPQNEELVFTTLFRMLKRGGRLYFPKPAPSLIGVMLPMPENVRVWKTDPESEAWKKRNREAVMTAYFAELEKNLKKSGFSIKFVNNNTIHGDPIFDYIRINTIDYEAFRGDIPMETFKNFPVLIAEKR